MAAKLNGTSPLTMLCRTFIDARDDNVGRRAKPSVSDDPEDDTADAAEASHSRLRPQPSEPKKLNLNMLPKPTGYLSSRA